MNTDHLFFFRAVRGDIFIALIVLSVSVSPFQLSAQQSQTEEKKDTVKSAVSADSATSEDPLSSPLYTYDQPQVEQVSYSWLFFKTMIILAFFGAGVYFAVRFLAKKGAFPNAGRSVMTTLSVHPLGTNRQLQLVECGTKVLLLGITDSQISLLREITEKDEIDRIKLQSSRVYAQHNETGNRYFVEHLETFVRTLGDSLGKVIDKSKKDGSNQKTVSIQEYEDLSMQNGIPETVQPESQKYTFFDDEKIDYLQQQKSRLKHLKRFGNE